MYRSILVPLDGSTFGEHALPMALSLARRAEAALQLLHVHQAPATPYLEGAGVFPDAALDEALRHNHEEYLAEVVSRIGTVPGVRVTSSVVNGEVASTIAETAARSGADLVVLTTHGRGPLGRFWLGSVADELVRCLPMPLLLVRPSDGQPDLHRDCAPRHILLPLDGSPLAEQMIEPAVALGGLAGADYQLLRIIHPILPTAGPIYGPTLRLRVDALMAQIEQAHLALRQEAQQYLDGVAGRLRAQGLRVQTRVASQEQAATAILHEAARPGIDLIALATHGRRGLPRLFLGSVADKVVRGAAMPVLVHRPHSRS
jgi:nucleotide-binding universal stress UspA family protein